MGYRYPFFCCRNLYCLHVVHGLGEGSRGVKGWSRGGRERLRHQGDTTGAPQRLQGSRGSQSCLRVSLSKRCSPGPAGGRPACGHELGSPVFLMSSPPRLGSHRDGLCAGRTPTCRPTRARRRLFCRTGWLPRVPGLTPLIWGRLLRILGEGAAALQERLGALALLLSLLVEEVTHALQSPVIAVQGRVQREAGARGPGS